MGTYPFSAPWAGEGTFIRLGQYAAVLAELAGSSLAEQQQTAAHFRQMRWRLLQILFLPLNFPKWRIFSPNFCIFEREFSDKKNIFRQAKIYGICLPRCPSTHQWSAVAVSADNCVQIHAKQKRAPFLHTL